MLSFLFMLLLSGCVTNKRTLKHVRGQLGNTECLTKLEKKLYENECFHLEAYRGRDQVVLRCQKPDIKRKNIWDTWWFRITSSKRKILVENLHIIKKHTICIDKDFRLETYPYHKEVSDENTNNNTR